jgi:hypothetical protein
MCTTAHGQGIALQRELQAVQIQEAPKLNGILDDACWKEAKPSEGFTIFDPLPGTPLSERTEVRFVYDNEAIYVAITNYQHPDSILQQLSGRDQSGNSDFCGVVFSCYRDGINGFQFTTTPAGEQSDVRIDALAGEDETWNAVWNCKTHKTPEGWTAEFKIPFAAIRFKNAEEQIWNINFIRHVRHKRHTAFWNEVNPLVAGTLTQMGKVVGITGIEPPKRIFLFPYASTYLNTVSKVGISKPSHSYNVGMDLKLGLNDAFTLDATLVPDFGQVISDQLILNVTPFEVQFQDFRQFFAEGTELFNKAGLFYSRRIGGTPIGKSSVRSQLAPGETIVSNPDNTQLINATKISGRNAHGLGIGFFNSVTAEQHALVSDSLGNQRKITTSPLSNYNVVVFDQNLKHNSYFSLINTNVTRTGSWYDANVIGTQFDLRNQSGKFAIRGSGAFNVKYGQRGISTIAADNRGYKSDFAFAKIKGNYTTSVGVSMMSHTFDPNDFGFNTFNNFISYFWENNYNIYKPFGRFNNMWSTLNVYYNTLYKPNAFTGVSVDGNVGFNTRKWHTFNVQFSSNPTSGYNYFEPRVAGMKFRTNSNVMAGGWISTDYRRPVALDAGTWYTEWSNPGRYQFNWRVAPRFRLNDHWFVTYVYSKQQHFNDLGFATFYNGAPVFGRRDVISHTNVLNIAYSITPWMTTTCRVRHYWGYSRYHEFFGLKDDGDLGSTAYDGFRDENGEQLAQSLANRNFNSFTVDLVYRWIFTPGSEVSVVWKNAIIQEDNVVQNSLPDDLDYTFRLPVNNNFSVKVLFFVDYRQLTQRKRAQSQVG